MKPRASSCFPCASPSVRFYSNPGWGPNSRQGLVKGTTHTPHERFPPGDCSFPATHKWDSSFKGVDMLPLSAGPSADIRAVTSQPTFFFLCFYSFIFVVVRRRPEQAWIMSDMLFWHGSCFLSVCFFFFSFFFFSVWWKKYNEIIDSPADCVSASCEMQPCCCQWLWSVTTTVRANGSQLLWSTSAPPGASTLLAKEKKNNPVTPSGSRDHVGQKTSCIPK